METIEEREKFVEDDAQDAREKCHKTNKHTRFRETLKGII